MKHKKSIPHKNKEKYHIINYKKRTYIKLHRNGFENQEILIENKDIENIVNKLNKIKGEDSE